MRPSEVVGFYQGDQDFEWSVFRSPKPSDIGQGILGNCWSALIPTYLIEKVFLFDLLQR